MESENFDSDMANPWSCQSLYDYLYFCCPECETKCPIKQDFVNHAILEHPTSLSYFNKIEDGSTEDISFPNNQFEQDDFDMKELVLVKDEIVDEEENIVNIDNTHIKNENLSEKDYNPSDLVDHKKKIPKKSFSIKSVKSDSNPSKAKRSIPQQELKEEAENVKNENNSLELENHEELKDKVQKCNSKKPKLQQSLCTICGDTFTSSTRLKLHEFKEHRIADKKIKSAIVNIKIQCDKCQITFEDTFKLNNHAFACYEDTKTFHCYECETDWVAGYPLLIHMKLDHGQMKAVSCDLCGICLSAKSSLEVHKKTIHEKLSDFICDTCGQGFALESFLKQHMKLKHAPDKHPCGYCDKTFQTITSKKIHENRLHTKAVEYPCKHCDQVFYGKGNLRTHVRQVHEQAKYRNKSCPHCDFKTFTKDKLNRHIMSIHNNETEYACDLCQKFVCIGQDSMREHMMNVHNQSGSSFKPRIKKPISEGAFSCSECEFKTNYKQNIKKHMSSVHSGGKDQKTKFHCDMCEYSSFGKDKLKLHREYTHFNRPKPFPCENCNRGFESRRDLAKHLSKCSIIPSRS